MLKHMLIILVFLLSANGQSTTKQPPKAATVVKTSNGNSSSKSLKNDPLKENKVQEPRANEAVSGQYASVKGKSHIKFLATAKMLGITSNVTGQFTDFVVSVIKNANVEKSEATVTIAAQSIDTDNARRDRHLKNSDFLDEKKYKNIIFKSKKIRHIKNNRFEVNGDVEIKKKSTNITFEVTVEQVKAPANTWRVKGEKKLDRNKLGIDYESPFFLPDVGNEITVMFDVVLSLMQP